MVREIKVGDKVRNVRDVWPDVSRTRPKIGEVCTVAEIKYGGECLVLAEYLTAHPAHARYVTGYELVEEASFDLFGAMKGAALKFRSGCAVKFVAFVADAKPHCQLVLLNPETGNVVTRYADGKSSDEPYDCPGDILLVA